MYVEGFSDQHGTHYQQERQRQHFQRRVLVDELADSAGSQHHHQYRNDDGGNHHRHVGNHADGGNHRVQGEHDVDDGDLDNGVDELATGAFGLVLGFIFTFQGVVHLLGAFPQQEQATEEQDQVATGDALAKHHEQVGGQLHDPGDRQQQQDARDHGQRQAEDPSACLHMLGHAADQDRNHDDVIDAQDDLKGRQGEEGNPDFRIGQPFHVYSFEQVLTAQAVAPRGE